MQSMVFEPSCASSAGRRNGTQAPRASYLGNLLVVGEREAVVGVGRAQRRLDAVPDEGMPAEVLNVLAGDALAPASCGDEGEDALRLKHGAPIICRSARPSGWMACFRACQ